MDNKHQVSFDSFLKLVYNQYILFKICVVDTNNLGKDSITTKLYNDVFSRIETLLNMQKYYPEKMNDLKDKQMILSDIMELLKKAFDSVHITAKQSFNLDSDYEKNINIDAMNRYIRFYNDLHDILSKLSKLNDEQSSEKDTLSVSFSSILDLIYNEFFIFELMVKRNCDKHDIICSTFNDIESQMKALICMQQYYNEKLPDLIDESKISQILVKLMNDTIIAMSKVSFDTQSPPFFKCFRDNIETIYELVTKKDRNTCY